MMNINNYLICIVLTIAASSVLTGQEVIRASIMHDNLERDYILYVPESYDGTQDVPLVFCFHGYTSSANTIMIYSRFNDVAAEEGFIIVYPQGELLNGITHWNVGGWTLASDVDDLGFTETLLDYLIDNYKVNEDRVYSTGMSNGGYMSFQIACQLSNKFAAVASVTGSMTPQIMDVCDPQRPLPILQIHGTADETVPYTGNSLWTHSIDEVMEYWIGHNNCEVDPEEYSFDDIVMSDGTTADHFIYGDGDNEVICEHIRINEGGHDWVGAWGNMDVIATNEVWRFFSQFERSGTISSTNTILDEHQILLSPNPCNDELLLNASNKKYTYYELYDNNGLLQASSRLVSDKSIINTSQLKSGVYIIKIENEVHRFIKI